jgi:hypothetical protein
MVAANLFNNPRWKPSEYELGIWGNAEDGQAEVAWYQRYVSHAALCRTIDEATDEELARAIEDWLHLLSWAAIVGGDAFYLDLDVLRFHTLGVPLRMVPLFLLAVIGMRRAGEEETLDRWLSRFVAEYDEQAG